MAGTSTFHTPPPREFELTYQDEELTVPEPLSLEEKTKQPLLMRILPMVMIGMMILMMVVMFTVRSGSGGGVNPMMFMFPVMMGMSMLMMFVNNSGGKDVSSLNKDRRDYNYALRELRRQTHKAGEEVHKAMTTMFPNPTILANYVGSKETGQPIMWQYSEGNKGGITAFEGTVDETSFHPFMSARVGTGITTLIPQLQFEPLDVPESLEPVTTNQFRSFVRTQGFIPHVPIGVNLTSAPAFALTCEKGDEEKKYGLARAMMASLTFNHSPNVLRVAVITDNADDPKWDFIKWLPHALHPSAVDSLGASRMVYSTVQEFAEKVPEAMGDPSPNNPRWVVFVDKPWHEVTPPQRTSISAQPNTHYVVVAARTDRLATSKRARLNVTGEDEIILPYTDARLSADYMPLEDMDTFARRMACWRPPTLQDQYEAGDEEVGTFVQKTWFDALGIGDIDEWDPKRAWQTNDADNHLKTPMGYVTKTPHTSEITNDILILDVAESSVGGTGPHGAGQGQTGTGKSIMLAAFTLGLAARYSADKVNFILMDFKGGSTFKGYERLPQTVMCLSNLGSATDLLDRAKLVIDGELQRRQELFDEYGIKDIIEYRKERRSNPDMPRLPYLFIIVDEYVTFIKNHREYLSMFEDIALQGRSLGMPMLLVSQVMSRADMGKAKDQLGYALSLSVNSEAESRELLGKGDASHLTRGNGDAILLNSTKSEHTRFRTFFAEDIYVPPIKDDFETMEAMSLDNASTVIEQDTQDRPQILPYTVSENRDLVDVTPVEDGSAQDQARAEREKARKQEAKKQSGEGAQMKQVLIDRIAREEDVVRALQLWKRSMRQPLTYSELQLPNRTSEYPRLSARVGIIDDPYHHTQHSWEMDFSSSKTPHLAVFGSRGMGKTVAAQSVIASVAQSYTPDMAQFLVLSNSGGIRDISHYPHVVGCDLINDEDVRERYLGEVSKVADIRDRKIREWGCANYAEYLERKKEHKVPGDPYGHLFLVLDGADDIVEEQKSSAEFLSEGVLDITIQQLVAKGSRTGIHLVVTALSPARLGQKASGALDNRMYLALDNPTDCEDRELRNSVINHISFDQPGRSGAMNLHSRVAVPQLEEVEPSKYDQGNPIYDSEANYGPNIQHLAQLVEKGYADQGMKQVTEVKQVPASIQWSKMWSAFKTSIAEDSPVIHQPIGVRTRDATIADVTRSTHAAHMVVAGETQSGKSNALRVMLNNAIQQRSPKNLKFVFYDPRNVFFTENRVLAKQKAVLGYATTPADMDKYFTALVEEIEKRKPTEEMMATMSREDMANRSWIKGPQIIVIIDSIEEIEKAGGFGASPFLDFCNAISSYRNLNIQVFFAARSNSRNAEGKLGTALSAAGMSALLLSGDKSDGKLFGTQFKKARPGLAHFYDTATTCRVQIPWAEPWDDKA